MDEALTTDAERARQIIEHVDVFKHGCSRAGDLSRYPETEHDPAACGECTVTFLEAIRAALA